jgi:hypothetical protein
MMGGIPMVRMGMSATAIVVLSLLVALVGCPPISDRPDASSVDAGHGGDSGDGDAGTANDGGRDAGNDADAGDRNAGHLLSALMSARSALTTLTNMTVDLDGDGRAELTRTIDGGSFFSDQIDFDADGRADAIWDYSPGRQVYRRRFSDAGVPASRRTAQLGDGGVILIVQEDDTNGDGFLDRRQTYSVDPSSTQITVSTERDNDYDGIFDLTYSSIVSRYQDVLATASQAPGGPCTAAQLNQLESAFDDAFLDGYACLAGLSPDLASSFAYDVARYDWNVVCEQLPAGVCARYDLLNYLARAVWGTLGGTVIPTVRVSPAAFTAPGCGSIKSIMFHESLHGVFGVHEFPSKSQSDPSDRVYGCERTCFSSAPTSQDCAQCLASSNTDQRCSRYPYKPCPSPSQVPGYCTCPINYTLYSRMIDCGVDCPSGLACFWATCVPVGPCAPP